MTRPRRTFRRSARSRGGGRVVTSLLGKLLRTRAGRITLVVLLLGLIGLWGWDAYLRPRHPGGPAVRIATWNLRQFSANREEIDYEAIASLIEREGFHVVALQEAKGEGQSVLLLISELNGGLPIGGRWKAIIGPQTGNAERFAFVYDADAVRSNGIIALENEAMLRVDRVPLAANFRSGNFDFTLVNLHLFASDTDLRRAEAAQVALLLADRPLPAGERDVIVLGDFNTTTRREAGSLGPFLEGGWMALNDAGTNLSDTDRLDNVLIRPDATAEWTGRVGVIDLPHDSATAERISDHQPVWADFAVTLEDDD